MTKPFVVAFNGARDFYEVPLALYEAGLLDLLVTDYYPGAAPFPLSRMALADRGRAELPPSHVTSSPAALVRRAIRRKSSTWQAVDRALGQRADRMARGRDADLLFYSHYAHGFAASHNQERRRILFQYHPHPKLIRQVLAADAARHPEVVLSHALEPDVRNYDSVARKSDVELRHSTLILTASAFTARSVAVAQVAQAPIAIVPYGAPLAAIPKDSTQQPNAAGPFRVLFVGQGVQRKGLHLLLKAWKRSALASAELIIVATNLDPGIAALATEGVTILPRQPRARLEDLYASADVFALPSLVEGFGLVLLEALAHGCHLLSTTNTGLPDLRLPAEAATLVPAGTVDELSDALVRLGEIRDRLREGREERQILAAERNWAAFRRSLRTAVSDPASSVGAQAAP